MRMGLHINAKYNVEMNEMFAVQYSVVEFCFLFQRKLTSVDRNHEIISYSLTIKIIVTKAL